MALWIVSLLITTSGVTLGIIAGSAAAEYVKQTLAQKEKQKRLKTGQEIINNIKGRLPK